MYRLGTSVTDTDVQCLISLNYMCLIALINVEAMDSLYPSVWEQFHGTLYHESVLTLDLPLSSAFTGLVALLTTSLTGGKLVTFHFLSTRLVRASGREMCFITQQFSCYSWPSQFSHSMVPNLHTCTVVIFVFVCSTNMATGFQKNFHDPTHISVLVQPWDCAGLMVEGGTIP